MKLKVLNKQNNSRHCVVCGLTNKFSLRTQFYETENNMLIAVTSGLNEHQSFPGRMHGGITAALLDEVVGRAVQIGNPDLWGVTGELTVRYKKPVPLNKPLKIVSKIIKDGSRTFEGVGFIEDEAGNLLAIGQATYVKLPINTIANEFSHSDWFLNPQPDDPKEIEIINDKFFESYKN